MRRQQAATEFGFATSPYLPPEHPRPFWRTLFFGALLALVPVIGPGVSAIYIDRRESPSTFAFTEALKTALIQILALVVIVIVAALVLTWLGLSVQYVPRLNRTGG